MIWSKKCWFVSQWYARCGLLWPWMIKWRAEGRKDSGSFNLLTPLPILWVVLQRGFQVKGATLSTAPSNRERKKWGQKTRQGFRWVWDLDRKANWKLIRIEEKRKGPPLHSFKWNSEEQLFKIFRDGHADCWKWKDLGWSRKSNKRDRFSSSKKSYIVKQSKLTI